MLSVEDNELVTNTNKGTPMGELFRRFWIPVALSEELPGPDCVPVKLKILNEDLIAFRDSDGKVGLIDAFCPHRGAPMFFARNEESGLRCVYHGWKFDVTGQCVDLPNTPEGDTFVNKIKTDAYPCREAGGMVFAYMGPKDKQPPFPEFDYAGLPSQNLYVTKFQLECNWLQATEGDFDPSHGVFLHSTLDNNASNPGFTRFGNRATQALTGRGQRNFLAGPVDPNEPFPFSVGNRRFKKDDIRSKDQLVDIDGAFYAIARVPQPDGQERVSLGLRFLMPTYCPPGVTRPGHFSSNIRVPIDNEKHDVLPPALEPDADDAGRPRRVQAGRLRLPGDDSRHLVKTKANVFNDYEVDRLGQKVAPLLRHQDLPAAGHRHDGEPVGPHRQAREGAPRGDGLPHDLPAPEAHRGRKGHARRHRAAGALDPAGVPLPQRLGRSLRTATSKGRSRRRSRRRSSR